MQAFGGTAPALVDEAVAIAPDAVAATGPDGTVRYGELAGRAEALARRLLGLGVRPGDLVGLCLDRSASLVVGALGIVKAGAAYVAIDPRYPDERVRWMLEDSGAAAVVTDAAGAGRVGERAGRPCVVLAGGGELRDTGGPLADGPLPTAGPDDIAYVVYTSGSTGRPKGVPIEHAGLANLVAWHREAFGVRPEDRCGQISSPGFDASVWEIWPALASGAAIHVVPEKLRSDPLGLRDWLVEQGITVTFLPTAVTESVLGLSWPAETALRYVLTGGDALTRRPPADLPFALVNNYGLSETTVVATSGVVSPQGDGAPSIGRPIAGVVAEVLDDDLRPVAPGDEGELVIGGVAVSPGYLGRDELTAQRFLNGPAGRRYRTGDRVRLRRDGEIEFVGRADDQLSIRGFRVEPGEVATALIAHPAVAAGVAVGAGDSSGSRRLVAYVVAAEGAPRPDDGELAAFVGASLPEYMVPSRFVWLDELPLTEHGKIDRGALPPVEAAGPRAVTAGRDGTPVEAAVAGIVAELLEVEAVGLDENFFLLGGHSMLGAQLIARLEALFDVEISLRHLFDNPTPAAIAAEVERQVGTEAAAGAAR